MKRIKGKSKSGFTLLEVVLATAIMAIASTMIMQGFITVMVLGANNRNMAKSGDNNYRMAMNQALIGHATAENQLDDLENGYVANKSSTLDATFIAGGAGEAEDLNLVVEVSAFSNPDSIYSYSGRAGEVDNFTSVADNRFAFFYDFGDYLGSDSDCIIRYGFIIQNNDVNDRVYGWYCFNEDHPVTGEGACAYRTSAYHPA